MRIPAALLGLSLVVLASAPFACSSQGEGQRCNVDNGNDDCEEGLVCTSSRELGGNADICCPASGTSNSPDCTKGGTTAAGTGGGTTGVTTGGGMGGGTTTSSSGGGGMGGSGGGTTSSSGGGGMGGGTTSGGGMSAGGGGAGGN